MVRNRWKGPIKVRKSDCRKRPSFTVPWTLDLIDLSLTTNPELARTHSTNRRTNPSRDNSIACQRTPIGDSLNDEQWCDDLGQPVVT